MAHKRSAAVGRWQVVANDAPPGSKCIVPAAPLFKLDPTIPVANSFAIPVPPRYDSLPIPVILLTNLFPVLRPGYDSPTGFTERGGYNDGVHSVGENAARTLPRSRLERAGKIRTARE